jgi:hypothetical protein
MFIPIHLISLARLLRRSRSRAVFDFSDRRDTGAAIVALRSRSVNALIENTRARLDSDSSATIAQSERSIRPRYPRTQIV